MYQLSSIMFHLNLIYDIYYDITRP